MEKYQVFTNVENEDGELQHEYNITDHMGWESKEIRLFRPNQSTWKDLGKEVAFLEDDGNGYKIKLGKDKKIKLNYEEAFQVLTLLFYCNEDRLEIRQSIVLGSI